MRDQAVTMERQSGRLGHVISYEQLADAGALRLYTEGQLRRLLGGSTITVDRLLALPIPLDQVFWAVMRENVLPPDVLHQLAVDWAREFLCRMDTRSRYIDFRTIRGLQAKQAWLSGAVSLGELRVAELAAVRARTDVAELDDEWVTAGAHIVCQALSRRAEDAQQHTFHTFMAHFPALSDRDWVKHRARTRIAAVPSTNLTRNGAQA